MSNLPMYLKTIAELETQLPRRKLTRIKEIETERDAERVMQLLHHARQIINDSSWLPKESIEYWGSELKKWYRVEKINDVDNV